MLMGVRTPYFITYKVLRRGGGGGGVVPPSFSPLG
jgi:hypothetical protein